MKYSILILLLFVLIGCSNPEYKDEPDVIEAQVKQDELQFDLYQSTSNSTQEDFFLTVAGENITLFGWFTLGSDISDTIYFRSNGSIRKGVIQEFSIDMKDIAYSLQRTSPDNWQRFDTITQDELKVKFNRPIFGFRHQAYYGSSVNISDTIQLYGKRLYTFSAGDDLFTFVKEKD